MESEVVMSRLVQGDVGSGKTVIAIATVALSKQNGYGSIVIAPTEILAKQHYFNFINTIYNELYKNCFLDYIILDTILILLILCF